MNVWMIQNILTPYRIRLFETIANNDDIDFKLVLLSKGMKNLQQWKFDAQEIPFDCEQITGISFHTSYDNQISISPRLLYRFIKDKPDVIICAGFSFATMQAFLYMLLTKSKYIIWMEGTKYTECGRDSPIRRTQRKLLARHAGALVDAGTQAREYLESLLSQTTRPRFFRSYNAVDNDRIHRASSEFSLDEVAYNEFKSRFPAKNILFVGQLIARKGINQLLEAYRNIIRYCEEDIGLIMLGIGPLEKQLRAAKEEHQLDKLYLEGFITQDVYPKYLAIADVVLIPSLFDPNPLVLFEALAAGRPVVASYRIGNAVDFIRPSENGYIVDPENTEEIRQRTLEILNQTQDQRRAMSAASLEAVKRATYDSAADAFVSACRYVVGRR